MSEEVKVIANISDDVISFETKEEFLRYYNKNKESVDAIKTRGLNLKFKIEGYKIGRQKEKIVLIPTKISTQVTSADSNQDVKENLKDDLKECHNKLDLIIELINDMMSIYNKHRDLSNNDIQKRSSSPTFNHVMNKYNSYIKNPLI